MPAAVDVHGPAKAVLMVASNPTRSPQTGWPIGFWWSELTHPYWEFAEAGYRVTIASPDGGALQADNWSDPADESRYSSDDLITRGFIASDQHKPDSPTARRITPTTTSGSASSLFGSKTRPATCPAPISLCKAGSGRMRCGTAI